MAIWVIRIAFLFFCITAGYAVSQVNPELIESGGLGAVIGFGFGGLLIAFDEMFKGFSLRVFSAVTFGLILGTLLALVIDRSGLFDYAEQSTRWLIRLCLFCAFGYIGIILAMRSNKHDFYLIIPFVRFAPESRSDFPLLMDTSAIIDGRIAGLIDRGFLDGKVVIPRFVLNELQRVADSADATKRARGRRGMEKLAEVQANPRIDVMIHETDFLNEKDVDSKLIRLAKALGGKLVTTDHNLTKIAELQSVSCLNVHEMGACLKTVVLPGDIFHLQIVREGKDKKQGVAYFSDGTMVVVSDGSERIGESVDVQIVNLLQTGAGVIAFAGIKADAA
jgi:uncharacterized protein YacL